MRLWHAVVFAFALPAGAAAQTAEVALGSSPPLPSIGLPLPSLGLPHPATGLPPPASPPPQGDSSDPGVRRGRHGGHVRAAMPGPVFLTPLLLAVPLPDSRVNTTLAGPPLPVPVADGRVLIEAQPDAAHIYVDGSYVGTPADYPDGLPLAAGTHALEFRAAGYESEATTIRVPGGRSISYRAVLTASSSSTAPQLDVPAERPGVGASAPATFYVIRGCYVGNVDPADVVLPPGCDASKAVAVHP